MQMQERYEVLKAPPMKIKHTLFWNVMSCHLADHYRCFGGTSLSIFGVQTAFERAKTVNALDRAVTVIGVWTLNVLKLNW
jgi:hypothetical protein